jgi:lipid II:glycine glycyltransferase (peptidoglycan interpeptide bridge formation enzyme)
MGAFKEDELLGGLIIIFQGDTAFYYKGYIDHDKRSMPINHLAFYTAMIYSRDKNMKWFDLGGYATGTMDKQLLNINKFKDGFKGELVEFSKTQMIGLNILSKPAYALMSIKFN